MINTTVIPHELKQQKRWAPWEAVWDANRGKYDKVPHNPYNVKRGISTTEISKWADLDTAIQACEEAGLAGIGYLMTGEHGIVGYDLDECLDDDGNPEAWALEVICKLDTYTEISPSGKGIRMFCKGSVPRDWNNHSVGIECYGGHAARYLTITTNQFLLAPDELREVESAVHEEIFSLHGRPASASTDIEVADIPDLLAEVPAIEGLRLSGPVSKFLLTGETEGDRSNLLFTAGCELAAAGLTDEQILSLFANNAFAWDAALAHRRQDPQRALAYLWKEHVLKARVRAGKGIVRGVSHEFEDLPCPFVGGEPPNFPRDKHGKIEANIGNVYAAVAHEGFIGMQISWDTFLDEIVIRELGNDWRSLRDDDYTMLRLRLEALDFKPVGRELIRDVVDYVARQKEFDTAIFWLNERVPKWDGVPRIDTFLHTHFGTEDNEYTRSVARYMWSAMAGRVLSPGVKADMVPVLVGDQGAGKSTAVAAMVPHHKFFAEIDIDEKREDTNSRKMRGCLIAELPELKGLQTRDVDYVKAFITRTYESWIPKFKEMKHEFARRLVFIGTTNAVEFLDDETGNRRWLPVITSGCDVAGIKVVRDQLWAEARELYLKEGIAYEVAERLGREAHKHHLFTDPWAERILDWLETPDDVGGDCPGTKPYLTSAEVASCALGIAISKVDRRTVTRIGRVLRSAGYERKKRRIGSKTVWAYTRECSSS